VLRRPVGSGKWIAGLSGLSGLSGLTRFRTSAKISFDQRRRQGCSFGTQKGSHLKVYFGGNQTILPMHPKKELKAGTVAGIKKRLGLK
jgi:predicted RNA binding protein YcfA (HicA-like mRNA interferase family)